MTQQWYLLGGVAAFIIFTLFGGRFVYQKLQMFSTPTPIVQKEAAQRSEPSVTQDPEEEQSVGGEEEAEIPPVVTYTDSGYVPDPLIIKKGMTVTFQNQAANPMWTASDQHPSHRLYPTSGGCLGSTFDSCAGTPPGESWTFAFDKTGSWNYHNHLYPINGGTIVVQE